MSFRKRHDYNFSSPASDLSRTNNRIWLVVATLDDHIRPKGFHEIEWCILVKKNDEVNALETCNKVRAIAFSAHRAGRSLEPFHRCVGVDSDNQCVTSRASGRE